MEHPVEVQKRRAIRLKLAARFVSARLPEGTRGRITTETMVVLAEEALQLADILLKKNQDRLI